MSKLPILSCVARNGYKTLSLNYDFLYFKNIFAPYMTRGAPGSHTWWRELPKLGDGLALTYMGSHKINDITT